MTVATVLVMTGEQAVEYRIRLATTADQQAVEEVTRAAYQPWVQVVGGRPAPMDADFATLIADERVHVAAHEGVPEPPRPVAGVLVQAIEDSALLIENIAVHPAHQRRGVGLALVTFAEATARERGLTVVRLFTHERMVTNIVWYEQLGFVITGTEPIASGRLVHLRKATPPTR
jgi:ribosomal protein S18 acetylase RimI-like enzyme